MCPQTVEAEQPAFRVTVLGRHPPQATRAFVLYWMTGNRRLVDNYALDRAIWWSQKLRRPLLIVEPLQLSYGHASPRIHKFIIDGMAEHRRRARQLGVRYYPYMERSPGGARRLLDGLGPSVAVMICDEIASRLSRRINVVARDFADLHGFYLEAVDSQGLLPVRAAERAFKRAVDFRRFFQREFTKYWQAPPHANPLEGWSGPKCRIPGHISRRWPEASTAELAGKTLARLPFAHQVPICAQPGGTAAAEVVWQSFLKSDLAHYCERRNHPDESGTTSLSAYLHFGHISPWKMLRELASKVGWTVNPMPPPARGQRAGWWGMDTHSEALLDQLVVWRELALNTAWFVPNSSAYSSLPAWAQQSLDAHRHDPRPWVYSYDQLEAAETHDELWNATQRQLRETGAIHGYLRMLWGKKILEWSSAPEDALSSMFELNDKLALDGRDANSVAGISWTLGRYDRAWGPERAVFGKVRYMCSKNTRRKLRITTYLERWQKPR